MSLVGGTAAMGISIDEQTILITIFFKKPYIHRYRYIYMIYLIGCTVSFEHNKLLIISSE